MRYAALLILLAACSEATAPTSRTTLDGTWTLATVNGAKIPYVTSDSAGTVNEVTGDVYTLRLDGSFSEVVTVEGIKGNAGVILTIYNSGAYALDGSAVTITSHDGRTVNATFDGFTLTQSTLGGKSAVASFVKQ